MFDGAAPFYRTYRCADGEHMAVGRVEPQFYQDFLQVLDLTDEPVFGGQTDPTSWPRQAERLEQVFATRPRDEWGRLFEGTKACTTPVLSLAEAAHHKQMTARSTLAVDRDGVLQPMPAPRFGDTPLARPRPPTDDASDVGNVLRALGLNDEDIAQVIDPEKGNDTRAIRYRSFGAGPEFVEIETPVRNME